MGHSGDTRLKALVSELIETRRRVSELQAREMRLLAEGLDLALERMDAGGTLRPAAERDLPLREIAAEFGAAMRLSDRSVQARMGTAASLVTRFSATLAVWEEGRIGAGHVSAIIDAGSAIDDDEARSRFEQHVLPLAEHESPSRLRPLAKAVAATVAAESDEVRLRRAQDDRVVRVLDLDDGLARLIADGPAPLIHAIHDRLTQMGRSVIAARAVDGAEADENGSTGETRDAAVEDRGGRTVIVTGPGATADDHLVTDPDDSAPVDRRTLDQVRADIFADLLLAGAPAAHGDGDGLAAITGHVQITVPALTLVGVGSAPGVLAGSGPIDRETARRLAANAPSWSRVLTDPARGHPLAVDRYRPSRKQRRYLAVRDEHCRFPGCRMPVWRCDVDHTVDAAEGGPTSTENLAHLCRRHHVLKHNTAWTVRRRGGGVLEWMSPTGRAYAERLPATLRFVPTESHRPEPALAGEPPPF